MDKEFDAKVERLYADMTDAVEAETQNGFTLCRGRIPNTHVIFAPSTFEVCEYGDAFVALARHKKLQYLDLRDYGYHVLKMLAATIAQEYGLTKEFVYGAVWALYSGGVTNMSSYSHHDYYALNPEHFVAGHNFGMQWRSFHPK